MSEQEQVPSEGRATDNPIKEKAPASGRATGESSGSGPTGDEGAGASVMDDSEAVT